MAPSGAISLLKIRQGFQKLLFKDFYFVKMPCLSSFFFMR
jgi:hypothetical protein